MFWLACDVVLRPIAVVDSAVRPKKNGASPLATPGWRRGAMALGLHFCAVGLGLFPNRLVSHHRHVPDQANAGHALCNEGHRGVQPMSVKDFLQNHRSPQGEYQSLHRGTDCNVLSWDGAGAGPFRLGFPISRKPLPHPSEKGVRVFNTPQTGGQSGFGENNGLQGKASRHGLSKREQVSILGVGKSSAWPTLKRSWSLGTPDVVPMEKRARGEGAFRHVLPADDGSEPERRQRGSFAKAMEVASDRLLLNKAIGELNQGFWAKGTLSVKRIRRPRSPSWPSPWQGAGSRCHWLSRQWKWWLLLWRRHNWRRQISIWTSSSWCTWRPGSQWKHGWDEPSSCARNRFQEIGDR